MPKEKLNITEVLRLKNPAMEPVLLSEWEGSVDTLMNNLSNIQDTLGRFVPQDSIDKLDRERVADAMTEGSTHVRIDGYFIELDKIPDIVLASAVSPLSKELIDIALDFGLTIQRVYNTSYLRSRKIRMRGKSVKGRTFASIPDKIYLEICEPCIERATLFHEIGHAIMTRAKYDTSKDFIEYADEMAAWEIGFSIARRYGYHYKDGCREMQYYKENILSYLPPHLKSLGITAREADKIYDKAIAKLKPMNQFPATEKTVLMSIELSKHIQKYCIMTPDEVERNRKLLYLENGIEVEGE